MWGDWVTLFWKKKQLLFVFQWTDWTWVCGTSWRKGISLILCVIRRQFSYKTSSRAAQWVTQSYPAHCPVLCMKSHHYCTLTGEHGGWWDKPLTSKCLSRCLAPWVPISMWFSGTVTLIWRWEYAVSGNGITLLPASGFSGWEGFSNAYDNTVPPVRGTHLWELRNAGSSPQCPRLAI